MPLLDDIQRVWRRFQRYTGDGLPNPPVGHPLSSGGDPRSGIYNPDKTEIRDLLVSIAQTLGDPSALASILTQLDGKADDADVIAETAARQLEISAEIAARAEGDQIQLNRALAKRSSGQSRGERAAMWSERNLDPLMAFDDLGRLVANLAPWSLTLRDQPGRGDLGLTIFARESDNLPLMRFGGGAFYLPLHSASLGSAWPQANRGEVIHLWGDELNPGVWRDGAGRVHLAGEDRFAAMGDVLSLSDEIADLRDQVAAGTSTGHSGPNYRWPDVDAYDVTGSGRWLGYLSPQWRGEARRYLVDTTTRCSIAAAPQLSLSLAVGQGWVSVDAVANDQPFHALAYDAEDDELISLNRLGLAGAAQAHRNSIAWADRRALRTVASGSVALASAPMADWLASKPALDNWLTKATASATAWGMSASLRSLILCAGSGDLSTDPDDAALALVDFVGQVTDSAATITGQTDSCILLATQFCGDRDNGDYTGTLALAKVLDLDPYLPIYPLTPLYPYPLRALSSAPTDEAISDIAALAACAIEELEAGRQWYGPRMVAASRVGTSVTVNFEALSNLVADSYGPTVANLGFALRGATNGVTITAASISGKDVTLTLSGVPTGTLHLDYAYGASGDRGDGFVANRGAIRDSFGRVHPNNPEKMLRRWAVSDRLALN